MAQFARPDNDFNNPGSWTDEAAGSTNIFQSIDETSPSDADYIQSPLAPSTAIYVARLSDIEDPVSSTGHVLRTRYAKNSAGGAQIDIVNQLREGYVNEGSPGTLIVARTFTDVSETFTTDAYTLSAGEADSITDYTDLFMRMTANQV